MNDQQQGEQANTTRTLTTQEVALVTFWTDAIVKLVNSRVPQFDTTSPISTELFDKTVELAREVFQDIGIVAD